MRITGLAAVALTSWLAVTSRAAAETDEDPTLAVLLAEADAGNPDLAAASEALAGARARPPQARALPDPMLSLGYTNEGWSPSLGSMPDTTISLMVSQDLPWPGKRGLRDRIARRDVEIAERQLERARLSVAASVRRAYHGLRQARLLLELAREQGELWREIEGVARARYGVGQGTQQDVLRTQVEVTRIGLAEQEQRAEETTRQAELARLLGRNTVSPIATDQATGVRGEVEPLATALERSRAISPELAASRSALERARLAVQLARRDFKPDLTVQAGYMSRGSLDPMWQVGVGVTIPRARARRHAALAEAEAQTREANERLRAIDAQLRLRTEERLARLEAIGQQALLYEQGIVPQDRLSVEAAVANYQAGRVPFVTVLEALGTLYADRGALIRLQAGHARTMASLEEVSLEATSDMSAITNPGMAAPTQDAISRMDR